MSLVSNVVFNVISSFAIILRKKRELITLLGLCVCCHVTAMWLSVFCLSSSRCQYLVCAFPGHRSSSQLAESAYIVNKSHIPTIKSSGILLLDDV